MLRRHPRTAFGSVHVFPGGVVDAGRPRRRRSTRAAPGSPTPRPPPGSASPSGGRAYWVAAIRESFEEAGVLLARRADGEPVRFDGHPDVQAPLRRAPPRGRTPATRSLARRARRPRTSCWPSTGVRYVAHWITPEGEPKRFDTRFFLARAPEGQAYAHDDARADRQRVGAPGRRARAAPGRRLPDDRAHHRLPPGHRPLRHLRRAARRPTTSPAPARPGAPHDRARPRRGGRRSRGPSSTGWPAR